MGSPVIFNGPHAKVLPASGIKLKGGTVVSDSSIATGIPAPTFVTTLISGPRGFAQDENGNIYVSDSGNSKILKTTPGGLVTSILGSVSVFGMATYGDYLYLCNTTGSVDRFKLSDSTYDANWSTGITSPYGMCVDSNGIYGYVASVGLNAIIRITLSTGANSVFISTGAGGFGSVDDVCIDPTDTYLYATDYSANDIKRVTISSSAVVVLSLSGASTTSLYGIDIDSTGLILYATCHAGSMKAVKIVVTGTNGVVTDLATFSDVFHILLDSSELFALVSLYTGSVVQRILLSTNAVSDWLGDIGGLGNQEGTTHYPVDSTVTKLKYSLNDINVNYRKIKNVLNPTSSQDAATMGYVIGITDLKVDENAAITGATKTKITYDAKGLVTAGTDATTADIADSSNKRYVTDADLTDIGNLSGTNTGDQTISDATITTTDITTNNFTTAKHGFVPKGTNVGNYLKDDGTWAVAAGVNTFNATMSNGLIIPTWDFTVPAKLANPATLPTGSGNGVAWSPNGQFLAVAHATSPYVTIYERTGTTLLKLSNPSTLPVGQAYGLGWSSSGEFLCVTHDLTPFITIYQRSGTTFTKLSNPANLPTGACRDASWSPDGQFLSVAIDVSPYIIIYQRSGTTFTKLTDPATLPTGNGFEVAWSPDGQFLVVAHFITPFITIYQRSGTTFTKLTDPATLPSDNSVGVDWSPSGEFLSIGHFTTPFITIYQRSGTTFTKLTNPATLPPGTGRGSSWSPDGRFLCIAHSASPYLTIYDRSGTTFTKITDPVSVPISTGVAVEFTSDGQYLSICFTSSPYVETYRTASNPPTITGSPNITSIIYRDIR